MNCKDSAVVIRVGTRYFCGWTRSRAIQTAWSLAGAEMFGPWDMAAIDATVKRIAKTDRREIRCVTVVAPQS